jgi:hypothetical protein
VEIATLQADHRAIVAQLMGIPTRKEVARLVLFGTLACAAMVLCGIELLFR